MGHLRFSDPLQQQNRKQIAALHGFRTLSRIDTLPLSSLHRDRPNGSLAAGHCHRPMVAPARSAIRRPCFGPRFGLRFCFARPHSSRQGHTMQNVVGHSLILAAATIAAGTLSYFVGAPDQAAPANESPVVVVTVPSRPREPATRVPVGEPQRPATPPADRVSLTRELQRELRRVGCYDGELSGIWGSSSRLAMKKFTDQVNAKLPIDQPDYILLRLVQGHPQRACNGPCPPEQAPANDGRCLPDAITADAARKARPYAPKADSPAPAEPRAVQEPPPPTEPPRVAAVAPRPDRPAAPLPSDEPPRSPARLDAPVPPVGVYEKRSRYRTQTRPPKFVRSLVRSVQRTLAPWVP